MRVVKFILLKTVLVIIMVVVGIPLAIIGCIGEMLKKISDFLYLLIDKSIDLYADLCNYFETLLHENFNTKKSKEM